MADDHWDRQADIGPSTEGRTARFSPIQQYVSLFFAKELILVTTCLRHLVTLPRASKAPFERFSCFRMNLVLRHFGSALTMVPIPRPSPRRDSLT